MVAAVEYEKAECAVCKLKGSWAVLRFGNDCHYMCDVHMKAVKVLFERMARLAANGVQV